MLQPLELLEWEPPQIHEQELLQLLVPRWCRAVGVVVAWVADSLLDAAVISSAECVDSSILGAVAVPLPCGYCSSFCFAILALRPLPMFPAYELGQPMALLEREPTQIHE